MVGSETLPLLGGGKRMKGCGQDARATGLPFLGVVVSWDFFLKGLRDDG